MFVHSTGGIVPLRLYRQVAQNILLKSRGVILRVQIKLIDGPQPYNGQLIVLIKADLMLELEIIIGWQERQSDEVE